MSGCFNYILAVVWMSVFMSLPWFFVGCSVIYNCGFSWSYSIVCGDLCFSNNFSELLSCLWYFLCLGFLLLLQLTVILVKVKTLKT